MLGILSLGPKQQAILIELAPQKLYSIDTGKWHVVQPYCFRI